jgi:hypothetical protein
MDKLPSLYASISDRKDIMDSFYRVHVSEVMTPTNGYICLIDHYWVVDGDDYVLFKDGTPMCSRSREIAQKFGEHRYDVKLIPVSYISQ